jgi:hypothetical protein
MEIRPAIYEMNEYDKSRKAINLLTKDYFRFIISKMNQSCKTRAKEDIHLSGQNGKQVYRLKSSLDSQAYWSGLERRAVSSYTRVAPLIPVRACCEIR